MRAGKLRSTLSAMTLRPLPIVDSWLAGVAVSQDDADALAAASSRLKASRKRPNQAPATKAWTPAAETPRLGAMSFGKGEP